MGVEVVWETWRDKITIPMNMSLARHDQLQGTVLEQLGELSGRICYDSLGAPKSRDSASFWNHILEVRHHSILRHCNVSAVIQDFSRQDWWKAANIPGLWIGSAPGLDFTQTLVNFNLQTALESKDQGVFGATLYDIGSHFAPSLFKEETVIPLAWCYVDPSLESQLDPECKWVSLYIEGSRAFTHELVRHAWRCAVSQESTRYVDIVKNGRFDYHPALRASIDALAGTNSNSFERYTRSISAFLEAMGSMYESTFQLCEGMGHSKKEARGAARSFIVQGLQTRLIFSASVAEWRRILSQRLHVAADGEMQKIAAEIRAALLTTKSYTEATNANHQ